MADGCDVTVVLPCLDEEGAVGLCVTQALDAMRAAGLDGEVVVVDNGSTDESAARATAAGARVVAEATPGYGAALRRGIDEAAGRVVVMADADATYPLDRLAELVEPVRRGEASLAMGSRLDEATLATMPFLHRWLGTPTLSWLNRRAAPNLSVRDSQSGFRAFDRQAILDLDLRATGMEFASEMLIRASQHGLVIVERPMGYRERIGDSKLRTFSDGWRHLQQILYLAPDLLLLAPGAVLTVVGVALAVLGLVAPGGVSVGSLQWQPIFFSTICIVLGFLALLSGATLAEESSVVSADLNRRFAFVATERFRRTCLGGGVTGVLLGLVINGALFWVWISEEETPSRALALASIAQTLIIVGAVSAFYGVIAQLRAGRTAPAPSLQATT